MEETTRYVYDTPAVNPVMVNGLELPDALLAMAVTPEYAVAIYDRVAPPVFAMVLDGVVKETLTPVGAADGVSTALTLVGATGWV